MTLNDMLLCRQEAFREREKMFAIWQSAQATLAKKRDQEAKLKISGKPEKLTQVQDEIKDVRRGTCFTVLNCFLVLTFVLGAVAHKPENTCREHLEKKSQKWRFEEDPRKLSGKILVSSR